jgi:hypothetical protein
MSGRVGELVYRGLHEISAHVEVSGAGAYDFLVALDSISSPNRVLSAKEREEAIAAFKAWAKREGVRCEW